MVASILCAEMRGTGDVLFPETCEYPLEFELAHLGSGIQAKKLIALLQYVGRLRT
jgi:hypothetical protein